MTPDRVKEILTESRALLTGHFLLASGLHSDTYLQCALALQYPKMAEELASALAEDLGGQGVETVCGPALGGVVIAYELARQMGARAIFTERKNGVMMLRRGFKLKPGEKVVLTEDVVTTGGSAKEAIQILTDGGANVVAAAAIVDRGGGSDMGLPFKALFDVRPPTWPADTCPLCKDGVDLVKPGGEPRRPA